MSKTDTAKSIVNAALVGADIKAGRTVLARKGVSALLKEGLLSGVTPSMIRSSSLADIHALVSSIDHEIDRGLAMAIEEAAGAPAVAPPVVATPAATPAKEETAVEKATRELKEALEAEAASNASAGISSEALEEVSKELVSIKEQVSTLQSENGKLSKLLDEVEASKSMSARVSIAAKSSDEPILKTLLKRYEGGKECLKTMLLAPPSFGKSRAIDLLGRTYDVYLKHGCSTDVDEQSTVLGGPTPNDEKGGFICVDGVLTQAVREAASGKNVLFFLDEILRWTGDTLTFLLTFLEPIQTPEGDFYELRTRKVKDGKLEVLRAPVEKLHIVAAANLGIDIPAEALWSRFAQERLAYTATRAQTIAKAIAEGFGIKDSEHVAVKFENAMTLSRSLCHSNRLQFPIDFRLLKTACKFAGSTEANDVLEFARGLVDAKVLQWDERSGEAIADSVNASEAVKGAL